MSGLETRATKNSLHPLTNEVLSPFNPNSLIALAQEWIRIPSQSEEERRVMDAAVHSLTDLGLEPRLMQREFSRPNVVADLVGPFPGPTLVLNGHLDTVPPPKGGKYDPFSAVLEDGKLFGLGALDMKGSCAAMAHVSSLLNQVLDKMHGRMQLQFVCGEESGHYFGTTYLIEEAEAGRLPMPDYLINGEYTGLRLLTAERGSYKFGIGFSGKSTHTATARVDGVSAVYHAAQAILELERDLKEDDPLVGRGVISVNKIQGGDFESRVPDQCEIIIDRRMITKETRESVLKGIRKQLDVLFTDEDELSYEFIKVIDHVGNERYNPPNLTERENPVVQAVLDAHLATVGSEPPWFCDWFGTTDARIFRYRGIPAVSYGPAGKGAHAPNEYVEVDSLHAQVKVLVDSVLRMLVPGNELSFDRPKNEQ